MRKRLRRRHKRRNRILLVVLLILLGSGGTATMYFEGRVVNHPSSKYHQRSISDCIFIN